MLTAFVGAYAGIQQTIMHLGPQLALPLKTQTPNLRKQSASGETQCLLHDTAQRMTATCLEQSVMILSSWWLPRQNAAGCTQGSILANLPSLAIRVAVYHLLGLW